MSDRSTKDKAMAAYLKAQGVERTSCRCPMCPAIVQLTGLPGHLRNHGATAEATKNTA